MIGEHTAFFRKDGDYYFGNDPARGPWAADACHAGPVTAVIVRALEHQLPDKRLVRVTVNFRRPIPMAGFKVEADIEREGRSTATATATLTCDDGRICASATGLHLTTNDFDSMPSASIAAPDFEHSTPGGFPVGRAMHGLPFFSSGIEVRYPPDESNAPGPSTLWMRTVPIVDGETPSPFERLCPLADCGNAISRNANFGEATFVNPDITIVLFRLPESEWLGSSAISFWEPTGVGLAQAQLFDTGGAVGYALQTLIVTPVQK